MRLLVLRDQHDFVARLQGQLATRPEDITLIPVAWQAIGDTVNLQRLVEQQQPDFLVCAVFLPVVADAGKIRKFRSMVEQFERCARKNGLPLVFFSSGAVFDGARIAYREDDPVCPVTAYGKLYAELEQQISKKIRRHLIIRTTWLYGASGENFLTAVIDHVLQDRLIRVNSAGKSCPTSINDLARVLLAILLQLDSGADSWGIYHYAGADTALGFQFIEAILAHASQYDAGIHAGRLCFEHHEQPDPAFYFEPVMLKCHKLLENFGIHQRPWRKLLPAVVREHFAVRQLPETT